ARGLNLLKVLGYRLYKDLIYIIKQINLGYAVIISIKVFNVKSSSTSLNSSIIKPTLPKLLLSYLYYY
ncbi:hypothetical protein K458DRAFT_313075, partial [Lentithecium fluviatile CBS 122367]